MKALPEESADTMHASISVMYRSIDLYPTGIPLKGEASSSASLEPQCGRNTTTALNRGRLQVSLSIV